MVSINATLSELKLVADYETVTITKSNFHEFTFTKFDELSWTHLFPDLREKVLFQIRMTDEEDGTIVMSKEDAKFVGDWLWNVAVDAAESEKFRKFAEGMFKDEFKDDDPDFNFPTHFHRFVESKFGLTGEQEAEMTEMERKAKELGNSYRNTLGGWNVLIPVDIQMAEEILNQYEKTALPIEEVNSITLSIKSENGTLPVNI